MFSSVVTLVVKLLKEKTTWIITTFILAGVLIFVFFQEPVNTSLYYKEIDRLEKKVEALQAKDSTYVEKVDSLRNIQQYLTQQNFKLVKELETLQNKYEEDTAFISSASIDELTEFFTDRYRYLLRNSP